MIRACSRSRLRNPAAGSGSAFNPLSLFTAGEQGGWYDPSDMTSLFQDNLGTVPVTAADQAVGMMRDKSGRGNHATQATEASKPLLRNSGALWWLEFDGVDDFLVTGSINFTATDKMSIFSGLRKTSDAAVGIFLELSATINSNAGTFVIAAPVSAALTRYTIQARGDGAAGAGWNTAPHAAPVTNIVTGLLDLAGADNATEVFPRINGVLEQSAASGAANAGGGNFGNFPMYFGRRAGTSLPFVGNLYGLIVGGSAYPALTVQATESYMASKTGIVL